MSRRIVSLHQVFLNLVNNSCDAMPSGGEMEIAIRHIVRISRSK